MNINTCNPNDLYSLDPSKLALRPRNDPPSKYSSQMESQSLFNTQNTVEAQPSNVYRPQSQTKSQPDKYHVKYKSLPLLMDMDSKASTSVNKAQKQTCNPIPYCYENIDYFNAMLREHNKRETLDNILLAMNNMGKKVMELQTELISTREREKNTEQLMHSVVSEVSLMKEQLQGMGTAVTQQQEVLREVMTNQLPNGNLQDYLKNFLEFQSCLLGGQTQLEAQIVELLMEIKGNAAATEIHKSVVFQHSCVQTDRVLSSEQSVQCHIACVNEEKVAPAAEEKQLTENILPRAVKRHQSSEKPTTPYINQLNLESSDDSDICPLYNAELEKSPSKSEIEQQEKRTNDKCRAKTKQKIRLQRSYLKNNEKLRYSRFSRANQLSRMAKINCRSINNSKMYRACTYVISSPNSTLSEASTSGRLNDNLLKSDTEVISIGNHQGLEQDLWNTSL